LSWILSSFSSTGNPKKIHDVKRWLSTAFNGRALEVRSSEYQDNIPNVLGSFCMAQERCRSAFEVH
jgi:hypothetical protein